MQYKFLNDNILGLMKNKQINESVLDNFVTEEKNLLLLYNSFESFLDLTQFLNTNNNVFILNGFMGSGKSALIDLLPKILCQQVLLFNFNCFEATTLDDILLSLYTDFIDYHNKRKIFLPKTDSTIFSDKVNAFIKASPFPILFTIDSFEVLNKYPDKKTDIINFLNHLAKFDKIKIVISARNFDDELLASDTKLSNSIMRSLDGERFNNYLQKNGISANFFRAEELFKNTRGHYLYASMIVNILPILKITIDNLLEEYSKRNSTFYDFLVFKILTLVPDNFLKLLWFLSLIRHGVSEKFLIENDFATKEDIAYLESRMVLSREFGLLYLKDYIKTELSKTLELITKLKIHNFLEELYDSQLPKKPSERDLLISRATMRKEMEYHKKIVENSNLQQHSKSGGADNIDFSYLSYSKTVGHEWNPPKTTYEIKNVPEIKIIQPKNKRFELSKEELALLNSTSKEDEDEESFIEEITSAQESVKEQSPKQVEVKETLEELIKDAQKFEKSFDLESAVLSYKKAISHSEDPLFEIKKPLILTKLAICYKKLHDSEKALKHFEDVYNIYAQKEPVKANYILLSIAQMHNETFKYTLAKNVYEKILSSNVKNPPSLLIRVFLDLADIEDNNSNVNKAIQYCEKALIELEKTDDLKLSGEVYFKYALLLDDTGKIDDAFKYYQKCIEVSEDVTINRYVSSAYSNLASIYSEQNNTAMAIKHYELAVDADKNLNNYEGLYFGYSKLAHIYQSRTPSKALEYLIKAMSAAKRLNDNFYCASAYLDLGDFYYNRKIDDKALKAYFLARKLILKQPNSENVQRVNTRINDLKVRLGTSKFSKLIDEFKTK